MEAWLAFCLISFGLAILWLYYRLGCLEHELRNHGHRVFVAIPSPPEATPAEDPADYWKHGEQPPQWD